MKFEELIAISPIDGRYRNQTQPIADYFSEFALIKYRTRVEVEYFISLCELGVRPLNGFDKANYEVLRDIVRNFSIADGQRIKEIEKTTNHDVKAVKYFLKEQFDKLNLSDHKEFIHFGLTSQDINNTATPMMWHDALCEIYIPQLENLIEQFERFFEEWKAIRCLPAHMGNRLLQPAWEKR